MTKSSHYYLFRGSTTITIYIYPFLCWNSWYWNGIIYMLSQNHHLREFIEKKKLSFYRGFYIISILWHYWSIETLRGWIYICIHYLNNKFLYAEGSTISILLKLYHYWNNETLHTDASTLLTCYVVIMLILFQYHGFIEINLHIINELQRYYADIILIPRPYWNNLLHH